MSEPGSGELDEPAQQTVIRLKRKREEDPIEALVLVERPFKLSRYSEDSLLTQFSSFSFDENPPSSTLRRFRRLPVQQRPGLSPHAPPSSALGSAGRTKLAEESRRRLRNEQFVLRRSESIPEKSVLESFTLKDKLRVLELVVNDTKDKSRRAKVHHPTIPEVRSAKPAVIDDDQGIEFDYYIEDKTESEEASYAMISVDSLTTLDSDLLVDEQNVDDDEVGEDSEHSVEYPSTPEDNSEDEMRRLDEDAIDLREGRRLLRQWVNAGAEYSSEEDDRLYHTSDDEDDFHLYPRTKRRGHDYDYGSESQDDDDYMRDD